MITKADKELILNAFKMVDVKQLEINHVDVDERAIKWFRFGSYNGMSIASEIIKQLPEKKTRKKAQVVS